MKIGIAGVSGRVGKLLCHIVSESGHTLSGGIGRTGDIAKLASASDIIIDFTHPAVAEVHALALAKAGIPWVLGTTGLDQSAQAAVAVAAERIGIVQAANFSTGIALVSILVRQLAQALPAAEYDVEILEMHHRGKRDAPSGTALALGRTVAAGRSQALADHAVRTRDGETAPRRPGDIGFAVLRGGAIVGEHAVSFTADSERITVTHEAFDRRVFAEGALRAALWLHGRPAGLYNMNDVLSSVAEP